MPRYSGTSSFTKRVRCWSALVPGRSGNPAASAGYLPHSATISLNARRYGVGPRSWKSPSASRRLLMLAALPVRSPQLKGRQGSPAPCQWPLNWEISSAPATSWRSAGLSRSAIDRRHSASLATQPRIARIH